MEGPRLLLCICSVKDLFCSHLIYFVSINRLPVMDVDFRKINVFAITGANMVLRGPFWLFFASDKTRLDFPVHNTPVKCNTM